MSQCYTKIERDGLTVTYQDGKIDGVWVGVQQIPLTSSLVQDSKGDFEALLNILKVANEIGGENFVCSGCAQLHAMKHLALQYFAGCYCSECSDKFKQEMGVRPCLLCGKPPRGCHCGKGMIINMAVHSKEK